jgi:glutathione peroxidase-family protein
MRMLHKGEGGLQTDRLLWCKLNQCDVSSPCSLPVGADLVAADLAAAAAARNYVKFLVNRDGQAVARYKPGYDPLDFEADVSDSAYQHCWQLQC